MTQAVKLVGIDIGTSSIKAVRIRAEGAIAVEAAVSRPYAADNAPTRDPALWARLAEEALVELTAGETVSAIGFTGQMHAMVALDDRGALAAPVRLWLDMDGAPDLDAFVAAYPGSIARETGNIPLPDFTLAKWLWARRLDPDLPARIGGLYCAKDYVRAALDPSAPFVVDRNEATGMQVFNPFADRWHDGLIERAGLSRAALPRPVAATEAAGAWRGIPMVVGVGDQAAAARAIGALVPGVASLSLGTSGVLSIPLVKSALPTSWDGAFHLFPTGFDDNYQVIGTVPAFGATLRWLQTLFGRSMAELDAAASSRPIGEGRALFVPYLAGAGAPHPDHSLAAALTGLTVDTDLPAIVRAVYDGTAQELAAITEEAAAIGAANDAVLLSGGATHLPGLVATLSAFLPSECRLVDAAEASAVGAALAGLDHLQPGNRLSLTTTAVPRAMSHALRDDWRRARETALADGGVQHKD